MLSEFSRKTMFILSKISFTSLYLGSGYSGFLNCKLSKLSGTRPWNAFQRVIVSCVMDRYCYVDLAVPLCSVCVHTKLKYLFPINATARDHVYRLSVLDRCLGDVYVSRLCEFSQ